MPELSPFASADHASVVSAFVRCVTATNLLTKESSHVTAPNMDSPYSDVDELNLALLNIAYPEFRFQLVHAGTAGALGGRSPEQR